MKIGYFVTHFPYIKDNEVQHSDIYPFGGAEIVSYHLAMKLGERGHEVYVFTTSIDDKDSFEDYGNVKIHRFKTDFRIDSGNFSWNIFKDVYNLDLDLDLIYAHFSTPPAEIAALFFSRKKKLPFVLTYHGDWQENFGSIMRKLIIIFYNRLVLRFLLSGANRITVPSEHYIYESRFLERYKNKIITIPNGVNIEDFDINYSKQESRKKLGFSLDGKLILFLGALTPPKRPDVLLKAMPIILKEMPDVRLIIVGSGKMKDELETLTYNLGISSNVRFIGFVNDTFKKALFYRAADLLVLPSATEVFPIVILEAFASGLPVVVSDLNTFRSIIEDGYNGVITKSNNENNLAKNILYLLENKTIIEKLSKNARINVERYSWDKATEMIENVFKKVTS